MGKKSCEVLARSKHLGHLDCLSISMYKKLNEDVFLFRANETLAPDALQQLAKG